MRNKIRSDKEPAVCWTVPAREEKKQGDTREESGRGWDGISGRAASGSAWVVLASE